MMRFAVLTGCLMLALVGSAQDHARTMGNQVHKRKASLSRLSEQASSKPSPRLTPEQVVHMQVAALENNDDGDRGIRAAFEFSSPDNREAVGPVDRFASIVRNPLYSPLLNHLKSRFEAADVDGDAATEKVTVWTNEGERVEYLFMLTRQADGPYAGCWMTDAVLRLPAEPKVLV